MIHILNDLYEAIATISDMAMSVSDQFITVGGHVPSVVMQNIVDICIQGSILVLVWSYWIRRLRLHSSIFLYLAPYHRVT